MDIPPAQKSPAVASTNEVNNSALCWACCAPLLTSDARVCAKCNRHQEGFLRHLPDVASLVTIVGVAVSALLVFLAIMQYQQASKEHDKARDALRVADEAQERVDHTERQLNTLKGDAAASAGKLKSLQHDFESQLEALRRDRELVVARQDADVARLSYLSFTAMSRTMPKAEALKQLGDTIGEGLYEGWEKASCRFLSVKDGKDWEQIGGCIAELLGRESNGR